MNELMNLDEIAKHLKLRYEYVRDRLAKRPDFPRPCLQISRKNKRWNAADVAAWQRRQETMNAR